MEAENNRRAAMTSETNYLDYAKNNSEESLKAPFEKRLWRIILRTKKMIALTGKTDPMTAGMIDVQITIETNKFMKQVNDPNNILDSDHIYEKDFMLGKKNQR